MHCSNNQGPVRAESQQQCKMREEEGKDFYYGTILNFIWTFYYCAICNFYICVLEKMVCQVTILIKSLLLCKSRNYLVTTPGSIKIEDLAQQYPKDTRETLPHTRIFKQTYANIELFVCLPNRNLLKCCRRRTGHLSVRE